MGRHLTDDEKAAVKEAAALDPFLTSHELAKLYGVAEGTIRNVLDGYRKSRAACEKYRATHHQHRSRRKPNKLTDLTKRIGPVLAQSDFIKPLTIARLMAGR